MPKVSRKDQAMCMQKSKASHSEHKDNMKLAVESVSSGQMSIRVAANYYSVSKSALQRMCAKYKKVEGDEKATFSFERKHGFSQIFTPKEEEALANYLIQAAKICYGLTIKATCELAYQFSIANNKKIPQSWHANKRAGLEWIRLFRMRWSSLSLRTPEATSLSRATSFNRHNVTLFF